MIKNLVEKLMSKPKSIHEQLKPFESDYTHKPKEIDLGIQGNEQLNNEAFKLIPPSSQCGYTTISVLLSQDIPEAKTDKFISDMIRKFEIEYLNGRKSRFAKSMDNHVTIYNYYLQKYNIKKRVVFIPHSGTIEQIIKALENNCPVGFSWMATTSGHFSAITGYSETRKSFLVQDPYKYFDFDAKKYTNKSGLNAYYEIDKLFPYMVMSSLAATNNTKKGARFLYLEKY